MTERSTISQTIQIGVESTPGTAVAANKKLASIMITPSIQAETDEFKPTGQKYASLVVPNREWVEASIEGKPCYEDIVYLLSCFLGTAVISTVLTTGKQWVFSPSSTAEDAIKTLTVEQGSAVRAHRFAYGLIKELGIMFSRSAIDLTGSMLGRPIEDGVTMTATPTVLALVPFLPTQMDFYLDTTSAGLGGTKLVRTSSIEWKLSDKVDAAWFVNSAISGFAAHVETDPTNELTLKAEADAVGMANLTALRAGTTRFLRIELVGAVIGAGTATYKATFDFAVKVSGGTDLADQDGVFGSEWPLTVVHDDTWGKAFQVTIVNSLASL